MQESWYFALASGYAVSLVAGTVVTYFFHWWTTHLADEAAKKFDDADGNKKPKATDWGLSSVITGIVERLVFTAFVILDSGSAVPAMGGWLTLKMAATWQRDRPAKTSQWRWISFAFLGLQTGFLSMALAAAGGLLARRMACWP